MDFRPLERLPIERAQFEAISNQVAELDTQANRENGKSLYTRLQTLLDSPANFPDRESSPDSLIDSLVKQRNAIMPATVRESDSP